MSEREKRSKEIRDFIIYNIEKHPEDIGRLTAEKFGLSRVAVANHLKILIKNGTLKSQGQTKAKKYELEVIHQEKKNLPVTPDLEEYEVWRNIIKPHLDGVNENILSICAHGFTEMFNNVIDHSESTTSQVAVHRTAANIIITVRDYGIGIFNKIQKALHLAEPQHAILELAKGKITTDKARHSGEGIFFTSRMFDKFMITSGTLVFSRFRLEDNHDWISNSGRAPLQGTQIVMYIATNATQTPKEIFDNYRAEFDEFGFSKTIIPLSILQYEGEQLISRSQAKRLMTHVDQFKEVVLDFNGITDIGQAFADEIFRVYRREHSYVRIYPINMSDEVIKMIKRVISDDPNDPMNKLFT